MANIFTFGFNLALNKLGLNQQAQQAARIVQSNFNNSLHLNPQGLRQFQTSLGRITGRASEFQKSMDAATARVFAFGAAASVLNSVSQSFKALIASTIEVEKRLVEINSIMGATTSEFNRFRSEIFEVAKNTGNSFNTVAEGASELARQGLNAAETTKRLNAALILTRVSGLDSVASVNVLTAALNGFTSSALSAEQIVNKIIAVDTAFAVSAKDLADGFQRAGSTAEAAGVSFDELLGLITAVQQTTARGGAVIGNALKSIFTRLGRGSTIDSLRELGVQINASQSGAQKLQALSDAISLLSDPVKINQIKELVGGVYQINVVSAALKDLSNANSLYSQATEKSAQATNEAYIKNAELNKSLSAQINSLVTGVTNLGERIGAIALSPVFSALIKSADYLVGKISDALDPNSGFNLIKLFFGGIGKFIAGPGLILIGGAFAKIIGLVAKFAKEGLKQVFEIGSETQKVKEIQNGIIGLLQQDSNLRHNIADATITVAAKQQLVINAIKTENKLLEDQQVLLNSLAQSSYNQGVRGQNDKNIFVGRRGKTFAAGTGDPLPSSNKSRDVRGKPIPSNSNFTQKDIQQEKRDAIGYGADPKTLKVLYTDIVEGGALFNSQEHAFVENGRFHVIPNYPFGEVPMRDRMEKASSIDKMMAAARGSKKVRLGPRQLKGAKEQKFFQQISEKYPNDPNPFSKIYLGNESSSEQDISEINKYITSGAKGDFSLFTGVKPWAKYTGDYKNKTVGTGGQLQYIKDILAQSGEENQNIEKAKAFVFQQVMEGNFLADLNKRSVPSLEDDDIKAINSVKKEAQILNRLESKYSGFYTPTEDTFNLKINRFDKYGLGVLDERSSSLISKSSVKGGGFNLLGKQINWQLTPETAKINDLLDVFFPAKTKEDSYKESIGNLRKTLRDRATELTVSYSKAIFPEFSEGDKDAFSSNEEAIRANFGAAMGAGGSIGGMLGAVLESSMNSLFDIKVGQGRFDVDTLPENFKKILVNQHGQKLIDKPNIKKLDFKAAPTRDAINSLVSKALSENWNPDSQHKRDPFETIDNLSKFGKDVITLQTGTGEGGLEVSKKDPKKRLLINGINNYALLVAAKAAKGERKDQLFEDSLEPKMLGTAELSDEKKTKIPWSASNLKAYAPNKDNIFNISSDYWNLFQQEMVDQTKSYINALGLEANSSKIDDQIKEGFGTGQKEGGIKGGLRGTFGSMFESAVIDGIGGLQKDNVSKYLDWKQDSPSLNKIFGIKSKKLGYEIKGSANEDLIRNFVEKVLRVRIGKKPDTVNKFLKKIEDGSEVNTFAGGYIPKAAASKEKKLARMMGAGAVVPKMGKGTANGGQPYVYNNKETVIPKFGLNGDDAIIPNYALPEGFNIEHIVDRYGLYTELFQDREKIGWVNGEPESDDIMGVINTHLNEKDLNGNPLRNKGLGIEMYAEFFKKSFELGYKQIQSSDDLSGDAARAWQSSRLKALFPNIKDHGHSAFNRFSIANFAIPKTGVLDSDQIKDPANAEIVKKGMKTLRASTIAQYVDMLTSMVAKKKASDPKNINFSGVFGAAGSGKTTYAFKDKENTFPILSPSDIDKASNFISIKSTSKGILDSFENKNYENLDLATILSSSTKEEQAEAARRFSSRNQTGEGLFGRSPLSEGVISTDSAFMEAALAANLPPEKIKVLGIEKDFQLREKDLEERVIATKKTLAKFYGFFGPLHSGHIKAAELGADLKGMAIIASSSQASGPSNDLFASEVKRGIILPQSDRIMFAKAATKDNDRLKIEGKNSDDKHGISRISEITNAGDKQRSFVIADDQSVALAGEEKSKSGKVKAGDILIPDGKRNSATVKRGNETLLNVDASGFSDYLGKGWAVSVLPRIEGISGTETRNAIEGGDFELLSKFLTKSGIEFLKKNKPAFDKRFKIYDPAATEYIKNNPIDKLRKDKKLSSGFKREFSNLIKENEELQFIPNFYNPYEDALQREMAAGYSRSQVFIDTHPLYGPAAFNTEQQPNGYKDISRRDAAAGKHLPNFADETFKIPRPPRFSKLPWAELEPTLDDTENSLEELNKKIKETSKEVSKLPSRLISVFENTAKQLEVVNKKMEVIASTSSENTNSGKEENGDDPKKIKSKRLIQVTKKFQEIREKRFQTNHPLSETDVAGVADKKVVTLKDVEKLNKDQKRAIPIQSLADKFSTTDEEGREKPKFLGSGIVGKAVGTLGSSFAAAASDELAKKYNLAAQSVEEFNSKITKLSDELEKVDKDSFSGKFIQQQINALKKPLGEFTKEAQDGATKQAFISTSLNTIFSERDSIRNGVASRLKVASGVVAGGGSVLEGGVAAVGGATAVAGAAAAIIAAIGANSAFVQADAYNNPEGTVLEGIPEWAKVFLKDNSEILGSIARVVNNTILGVAGNAIGGLAQTASASGEELRSKGVSGVFLEKTLGSFDDILGRFSKSVTVATGINTDYSKMISDFVAKNQIKFLGEQLEDFAKNIKASQSEVEAFARIVGSLEDKFVRKTVTQEGFGKKDQRGFDFRELNPNSSENKLDLAQRLFDQKEEPQFDGLERDRYLQEKKNIENSQLKSKFERISSQFSANFAAPEIVRENVGDAAGNLKDFVKRSSTARSIEGYNPFKLDSETDKKRKLQNVKDDFEEKRKKIKNPIDLQIFDQKARAGISEAKKKIEAEAIAKETKLKEIESDPKKLSEAVKGLKFKNDENSGITDFANSNLVNEFKNVLDRAISSQPVLDKDGKVISDPQKDAVEAAKKTGRDFFAAEDAIKNKISTGQSITSGDLKTFEDSLKKAGENLTKDGADPQESIRAINSNMRAVLLEHVEKQKQVMLDSFARDKQLADRYVEINKNAYSNFKKANENKVTSAPTTKDGFYGNKTESFVQKLIDSGTIDKNRGDTVKESILTGGKGLAEALFGEDTQKRKDIRSKLETRVQKAGEAPNVFNKLSDGEKKLQNEIGTTAGSAGNFKEFIERSDNREKIIGKGGFYTKSKNISSLFGNAETAQDRLSAFDQSKEYAQKLSKLRGQASNTPEQNAAIEAQLADLASFTAAQEQVSAAPSGIIQANNATTFRQNTQRKQQEIDKATVDAGISNDQIDSRTGSTIQNKTTATSVLDIPEISKNITGAVTAMQTNADQLAAAFQKSQASINEALKNLDSSASTAKDIAKKMAEVKGSIDYLLQGFEKGATEQFNTKAIGEALEENRKALTAKAAEIAAISIPKGIADPKPKPR